MHAEGVSKTNDTMETGDQENEVIGKIGENRETERTMKKEVTMRTGGIAHMMGTAGPDGM